MDTKVDSVGLIYWRRKEREIDGGKGVDGLVMEVLWILTLNLASQLSPLCVFNII